MYGVQWSFDPTMKMKSYGYEDTTIFCRSRCVYHESVYVTQTYVWYVKAQLGLPGRNILNQFLKRVSANIGMMRKLRSVLPQKSLFTLYNSIIYPYLSYCNLVWGRTFDSLLTPLYISDRKMQFVYVVIHITGQTRHPFASPCNCWSFQTWLFTILCYLCSNF